MSRFLRCNVTRQRQARILRIRDRANVLTTKNIFLYLLIFSLIFLVVRAGALVTIVVCNLPSSNKSLMFKNVDFFYAERSVVFPARSKKGKPTPRPPFGKIVTGRKFRGFSFSSLLASGGNKTLGGYSMNNTNQKRCNHHRRKRSAISVRKRVLHYQVYVEFFLTNGKPSLVNLEICSTRAACTTFFVTPLNTMVILQLCWSDYRSLIITGIL